MPYKDDRGLWKAHIMTNGKRLTKRFNTKREALAWEADVKSGKFEQKINTVCLAEWATAYLDFAKTKFGIKTYKEKTAVFKLFFQFVSPNLSVEDLTSRMVLDFIIKQKEQRSGYAANKDRKNLVAAWSWGIKYLGFSAQNPCSVDKMAEVRQPRYVPFEADFWAVYDVCEENDKVLLLSFLHTAARRGELFRLTWADVDFTNGTIRLATKKRLDGTMEYDILPMTDELSAVLHRHCAKSKSFCVFVGKKGNGYVERGGFMRDACKRAGVKHFGFHAIRHLTATTLYHSGCDVATIQAILRHKSPNTTERYLKTLGLEKVKKALDKLPRIIKFNEKEKPFYTQTYTHGENGSYQENIKLAT